MSLRPAEAAKLIAGRRARLDPAEHRLEPDDLVVDRPSLVPPGGAGLGQGAEQVARSGGVRRAGPAEHELERPVRAGLALSADVRDEVADFLDGAAGGRALRTRTAGRRRPSGRRAASVGEPARTRRSIPAPAGAERAAAGGRRRGPGSGGRRVSPPRPTSTGPAAQGPRRDARRAASGRSARRSCRTRPRSGRPARHRRSPARRSGCRASRPGARAAAGVAVRPG